MPEKKPRKLHVLSYLLKAIILGLALSYIVTLWQTSGPGRWNPLNFGTTQTSEGYAEAVANAADSIVYIHTKKVVHERNRSPFYSDPLFHHFFGNQLPPNRQNLQTSLGSGVIMRSDGYIMTNHHVIDGADQIQVSLLDGRSTTAQLAGKDIESDLAILKIDLPDLPEIALGSIQNLKIGDIVLAIGNPFGVGQSVSMGIVSALRRHRLGINTFENFIQTDAAINPGNSGGALINANGQLVGINTAIYSSSGGYQGIGFSIPIDQAILVMNQIIEYGHPVRGSIGVELHDLSPVRASSLGIDSRSAAVVSGVLRDSPAHQAGILPGDILLKLNKQPVIDAQSALQQLSRFQPETTIEIELIRNQQPLRVTAIVGIRNNQPTQRPFAR